MGVSPNGHSVLITGASTGIGHHAALGLVQRGFKVFAGVRKQSAASELRSEALEGRLIPVFMDVAQDASVEAAFETLHSEHGVTELWGLVNNAGIAVAGPLETLTSEELQNQFNVNVIGVHRVTRKALPLLRAGKGRIVNISSVSGILAAPILGAYCSSKFALEAYSDSLRREIATQGIKVSLVEPGPIKTPIWQKSKNEAQQVLDRLTPEQASLYHNLIGKIMKVAERSDQSALPPEVVVEAIIHALEAPSPRIRYPIGSAVRMVSVLAKALPDSLLDRLVRSQMRLV